jgi:hypothetical protein
VVVSGQFLIDSEASLLGAYQRMGAGTGMPDGMSGMAGMQGESMSAMDGMSDMKPDAVMGEMSGMSMEKTP